MSKINKKDDKKEEKEIKVEEKKLDEKKEERREQKKLFMEDVGMASITKKADDVSLKELVEKAKQNDPNVGIEGYKALVNAHKDSKEPQTAKVEENLSNDHFSVTMFVGAVIGVIILLTLFGGPYSPLSLLGSTFNPNVADAASVKTNLTPVVIPELETPAVAEKEVLKPTQDIPKTTEVNITFSNWKITPEVMNIKAGSTVLNIKTGETPVDIIIEGVIVDKVHIVPGAAAKIEFNSTVGTYKIRMIAFSGAMNIEVVSSLVVE